MLNGNVLQERGMKVAIAEITAIEMIVATAVMVATVATNEGSKFFLIVFIMCVEAVRLVFRAAFFRNEK